jgi:hypothetical protein
MHGGDSSIRYSDEENGEVLHTTGATYVVYLLQLEAPEVCLTSPAVSSLSEDMLGADLLKKMKINNKHDIFKSLPQFVSGWRLCSHGI